MNLRLADPELKPLQEAEVIELLRPAHISTGCDDQ